MTNKLLLALIGAGLWANAALTFTRQAHADSEYELRKIASNTSNIDSYLSNIASDTRNLESYLSNIESAIRNK
jgi:hypothetical protein